MSKSIDEFKWSSEIEPMHISPRFTVDDWKALTFSTEEEWQKAVDIFEDRIYGRFLEESQRR